MMNEDTSAEGLVQQDITFLIYLKHREEPINFNATLVFNREHLKDGREMRDLMELAKGHVLSTIDIVREHRYILSNDRFDKAIFLTEEVQAITILAPSEETLQKTLEG
jgi:hypothetical protein